MPLNPFIEVLDLVDFSGALNARIASMSPEQLDATELRRLTREADVAKRDSIASTWKAKGSNAQATTKDLKIKIDAGTAPLFEDIVRFSFGSTFHESVILTAATFRLLAGGPSDGGEPGTERIFLVHAGGSGHEEVTVDQAAFAAIVELHRPDAIALAKRLVTAELRSLTSQRLSIVQRAALFEEQWSAESSRLRIDAAVAKAGSRGLMMMSGRDHVALWVRKPDVVGDGKLLRSPLMAAIVQPAQKSRSVPVFSFAGAPLSEDDIAYLQHTAGSGAERTLVLDVGRLRAILPALPTDGRTLALAQLETLVARSGMIARERAARAASID